MTTITQYTNCESRMRIFTIEIPDDQYTAALKSLSINSNEIIALPMALSKLVFTLGSIIRFIEKKNVEDRP